ncbi:MULTISPECIES: flavodoxin family protein [Tenacibaculum]|uniref:flavodoxin family protein n=1 Tax=Tenacibaculum TaxID=104267 RepID=UPI001F0A86C9|nr:MULTISPECIES: NAD(P)H-dependent oxidoreductase [Tenacibaculum]MCH3882427.1 NAD(P)H-dependent oxidoreductase [Tenacibaculum aquimarinum]MDO6600091.1 NAD(P)H-dependent oxidoreductase [Tenacibaculum sp. 1_MG-2023]
MNKTVIIQGSANSFGNTHKVVNYLNKDKKFDVIDLKTKNIGPFEYDFSNANDDFLPLMEKIITNYDTLIFATPVYWYTMSGMMKDFFDRMSDLLHYKKELGRQLRGKNIAMISNSAGNDRRIGFEMPFIESAKYLGMNYLGDTHVWFNNDKIADDAKLSIEQFGNKI